jgi:hypothetical protein
MDLSYQLHCFHFILHFSATVHNLNNFQEYKQHACQDHISKLH